MGTAGSERIQRGPRVGTQSCDTIGDGHGVTRSAWHTAPSGSHSGPGDVNTTLQVPYRCFSLLTDVIYTQESLSTNIHRAFLLIEEEGKRPRSIGLYCVSHSRTALYYLIQKNLQTDIVEKVRCE